MSSKFTPKKIEVLPFRYGKQKTTVAKFEGKYKVDDIRRYAQEKSNMVQKNIPDSKMFIVTLNYKIPGSNKIYYTSGNNTSPGRSVSIQDPNKDYNDQIGDDDDGYEIVGFNLITTGPDL